MSVKTSNIYGVIKISESMIGKFVSHVGMDSYGIVEIGTDKITRKISDLFSGKPILHSVKVKSRGDHIGIDVYIVSKYGISVRAVAEAFKGSMKYKVEKFSGMLVDYVNVYIVDVRK